MAMTSLTPPPRATSALSTFAGLDSPEAQRARRVLPAGW